jgi:hypothetical protein
MSMRRFYDKAFLVSIHVERLERRLTTGSDIDDGNSQLLVDTETCLWDFDVLRQRELREYLVVGPSCLSAGGPFNNKTTPATELKTTAEEFQSRRYCFNGWQLFR